MIRSILAFALMASMALAGCPGTLREPERFAPPSGCEVAEVPERILVPACATAGCHGATEPAAGLDLVSPGLEARLRGVAGTTCNGRPLVDVATPERSQMYDRLLARTTCGLRMPLGAAPLPADDEACVLRWVEAVATTTTSTAGLGGSGR